MMAEHTPGPLFVHDFADRAIVGNPSVRDVTISCDHPATIEVAAMGGGLKGTLDEARANARRLVAAWNACRGIPTEDLEMVAVQEGSTDDLPTVRLSRLIQAADDALDRAIDDLHDRTAPTAPEE